jgi:hypothetical protein
LTAAIVNSTSPFKFKVISSESVSISLACLSFAVATSNQSEIDVQAVASVPDWLPNDRILIKVTVATSSPRFVTAPPDNTLISALTSSKLSTRAILQSVDGET